MVGVDFADGWVGDGAEVVAVGEGVSWILGAGGKFAGGAVAKVGLDVGGGGDVGGKMMGFESPLFFGGLQEAKIADAGGGHGVETRL